MEVEIGIKIFGYWREVFASGIPNNSGIYFVYEGRHDGMNSVTVNKLIYIGSSTSIRNDIKDHPQYPDWLEHVGKGYELCFATSNVEQNIQEQVRQALVLHHKPPVNHIPSAFPFSTTTISIDGELGLLEDKFTIDSESFEHHLF